MNARAWRRTSSVSAASRESRIEDKEGDGDAFVAATQLACGPEDGVAVLFPLEDFEAVFHPLPPAGALPENETPFFATASVGKLTIPIRTATMIAIHV